jgi:hypothetical protein
MQNLPVCGSVRLGTFEKVLRLRKSKDIGIKKNEDDGKIAELMKEKTRDKGDVTRSHGPFRNVSSSIIDQT